MLKIHTLCGGDNMVENNMPKKGKERSLEPATYRYTFVEMRIDRELGTNGRYDRDYSGRKNAKRVRVPRYDFDYDPNSFE